jgi:hypothetical protein
MNATSDAVGRPSAARKGWTPVKRAALVSGLAIAMGSLFVTAYTLALGDPIPRRIDAALIGNPASHVQAVNAIQGVAEHSIRFRGYPSLAAARRALNQQKVYAALDLNQHTPSLYLASAAGASVARVLERVASTDPRIHVIDTHPLASKDPNGLDIFYLILISNIIGFIAVFQVRANAGGLQHWWKYVVLFASAAALALTLVDGPVFHQLPLPVLESWVILALLVVTASSFASTMLDLIGRWAILPTWLFFVVLGNTSSGGAVSPPLLPRPFALVSEWLPSGAAVESLRDAVYFRPYQHAQSIAVLATWAAASFAAMLVASYRRRPVPA